MRLILIPSWIAKPYRDISKSLTEILSLEITYKKLLNYEATDFSNTPISSENALDLPLTRRDIEWYLYYNFNINKVLPLGVLSTFEPMTANILGFSENTIRDLEPSFKLIDKETKEWKQRDFHLALKSKEDHSFSKDPLLLVGFQPIWLNDTTMGLVALNKFNQTLPELIDNILYHLYMRNSLANIARLPIFLFRFQLET